MFNFNYLNEFIFYDFNYLIYIEIKIVLQNDFLIELELNLMLSNMLLYNLPIMSSNIDTLGAIVKRSAFLIFPNILNEYILDINSC